MSHHYDTIKTVMKAMKDIILVEDDITIHKALIAALSLEYNITIAQNMTQALEKINDSFDLWLIDISLPDGNGIDLCGMIRQNLNTPVLFLTANQMEDSIVKALESGGDDYVSKPFRIRELRARIQALLRRQYANHQYLQSKDIKIDLESRQAFKNNQLLDLTKTAFDILALLIQNEGIVLTRRRLMEFLEEGNDHYINDNTISVHIKRLREKIGTYENEEYIETIRGVGYRWKIISSH